MCCVVCGEFFLGKCAVVFVAFFCKWTICCMFFGEFPFMVSVLYKLWCGFGFDGVL